MACPVYRFDPGRTFPEIIRRTQSTQDSPRSIAAMVLAFAHVLGGNWFDGPSGNITPEEFTQEVDTFCLREGVTPEKLMQWAVSLLHPPEATLPAASLSAVPTRMDGPGFNLHAYQVEVAAWAALRSGTILALGCGVGKTATSVAAAQAAARLGVCSADRCFIVCPVNAMGTWDDYIGDLKRTFASVSVVSCDSLHHYQHVDPDPGGALIVDEAHKLKNDDADRTGYGHKLRRSFEWATCLTGSLLHTGAEAVLSLLDLSCPGLSRYLDKWAYGEAFNCIVWQKAGKTNRRRLVLVPKDQQDPFTEYLKRGVRSLTNKSPAVEQVINVPPQHTLLVDSWLLPRWARDAIRDKSPSLFGHTLHYEGGLPKIIDPGVEDWRVYLGAYSLAMMHERRAEVVRDLAAEGHNTNDPEALVRQLNRQSPGDDLYRLYLRKWELPVLIAVLQDIHRDGRFDRVLALVEHGKPDGTLQLEYRFIYNQGDSEHPRPGPKILYLGDWLNENPDEPIVVGAAGVKTLDMAELCMNELGVDYRLIRGTTDTKDRKTHIKDFQAGKFRVMLLQQVAGSESVTLTKACVSMLIDHDSSPITYTQYRARTCRQGQKRECLHLDLSYSPLQTENIHRLIRGEDFDAAIRKRIEDEVNYTELMKGAM